MTDLEDSYELSSTDLPTKEDDENPSQRALRESMVESWIEDLDEQLTAVNENFKRKHKAHFLTMLLYSIWNHRSESASDLSSHWTVKSQGNSSRIRWNSPLSGEQQNGIEEGATLNKVAIVEPIATLRFLLNKVQERHNSKYEEFFAAHQLDQIEKQMVSILREDVLSVLKHGVMRVNE